LVTRSEEAIADDEKLIGGDVTVGTNARLASHRRTLRRHARRPTRAARAIGARRWRSCAANAAFAAMRRGKYGAIGIDDARNITVAGSVRLGTGIHAAGSNTSRSRQGFAGGTCVARQRAHAANTAEIAAAF